ncbi:hypothetical protein [Streptomyces sp. NPDC001933]|uniref:hypothetical protein n=1 Tax=Streptomyces sp. NPDC001933 TaxID=3364626 RepID=UPI00368B550A
MRSLTFVIGSGRSGSTALSRIMAAHPEVLSLNKYMSSVAWAAFPEGPVHGAGFWRALSEPTPVYTRMLRSGVPLPKFLYNRLPQGRYNSSAAGVPALSLMVLPHLSDDPDGLLDELAAVVPGWPERAAADHHRALFDHFGTRFSRHHAVERSRYSTSWPRSCGPRSPRRGSSTCSATAPTVPCQ